MKTPRRFEALEQRRGRFRDSLATTNANQINQSISHTHNKSKSRVHKAHLDGFVWHTRHPARVSLLESKKGDRKLGFHLPFVWRDGRGRGREWTYDTRACTERDERCIRAYIRDDRI